jgi:MFS family permease
VEPGEEIGDEAAALLFLHRFSDSRWPGRILTANRTRRAPATGAAIIDLRAALGGPDRPRDVIAVKSADATRRARWAVRAVFFIDGAGLATWATHVPLAQEQFRLPDDVLGLALFAVAVGSVISLLLAGAVVARLGSRNASGAGTLGLSLALAALALVPTFPWLVVALLLLGLTAGTLDVAMNAQAVAVEERQGRPLLSAFHAQYSLGALAGAALAGLLLSLGVAGATEGLAVALVLAIAGSVAWGGLLPGPPTPAPGAPLIVWPHGRLLGLGVLALLSLLSEGAMSDWSAVYLHTDLGTAASFAATGYAAFSLAMAAGRFGGDSLRERVGPVRLLRLSGGLAALGLGSALLIGQPVAALVGFAGVGFGLANLVPTLFSVAGQARHVPTGTAIAAVATVGYLGFLVGPPVIGLVARLTSLSIGLGLVVLCTALTVPLAGRVAE